MLYDEAARQLKTGQVEPQWPWSAVRFIPKTMGHYEKILSMEYFIGFEVFKDHFVSLWEVFLKLKDSRQKKIEIKIENIHYLLCK